MLTVPYLDPFSGGVPFPYGCECWLLTAPATLSLDGELGGGPLAKCLHTPRGDCLLKGTQGEVNARMCLITKAQGNLSKNSLSPHPHLASTPTCPAFSFSSYDLLYRNVSFIALVWNQTCNIFKYACNFCILSEWQDQLGFCIDGKDYVAVRFPCRVCSQGITPKKPHSHSS